MVQTEGILYRVVVSEDVLNKTVYSLVMIGYTTIAKEYLTAIGMTEEQAENHVVQVRKDVLEKATQMASQQQEENQE